MNGFNLKLWVAKDDDGALYLYSQKPSWRINGAWYCDDAHHLAKIPNDCDTPEEIKIFIDL